MLDCRACRRGRSEIRDLIDLMFLERAGHRIESYIVEAERKDAGVSAATLAWLLSMFRIPERLPAEIDRGELEAFRSQLEARVRLLARPAQ